jgi:ParB/RepB/Spo0J family partition protein
MKTKEKTKPSALNGTPKKLKVLPIKTGNGKPKELPSDVGAHESILRIPLDQIELSPFNKRGNLNPQAIEALAVSIGKIDVIQPVVVREIAAHRYELVFGERRYRGSALAGKRDIPAVIRVYSDEEVMEVQNAENFQREAQHFMDEAGAIQEWLRFRSREEIAARIGRPLRYVKDRITLQALVPDIVLLARADKFTFTECIAIAALAPDSQQDFYDSYCKDQEDDEEFFIEDLEEVLDAYRRKLVQAPFDMHDALLVPSRGSCTACPMNTACTSLFPADEKDATCTDRSCYKSKVEANGWNKFRKTVLESKVTHYLQWGDELAAQDREALLQVPDGIVLDMVRRSDITLVEIPEMPEKMDYVLDGHVEDDGQDDTEAGNGLDEEEEEDPAGEDFATNDAETVDQRESEAGTQPTGDFLIDEVEFAYAMENYQEELDAYGALVGDQEVHTAVGMDRLGKVKIYSFIKVRPSDTTSFPAATSTAKYTSKEVMAAVRAGTVTIPMLSGEIRRINDWLQSKEDNDRAATQKSIHQQFDAFVTANHFAARFTSTDEALIYWYILRSMDFSDREAVLRYLFPERQFEYGEWPKLEEMEGLTPVQKAYVGCKAIIAKEGSDKAGSEFAEALKSVAGQYIDIPAIQVVEEQAIEARRLKKMPTMASLQAKMNEFDPSRPKQVPEWVVSLAVDDCASLDEFISKYKATDADRTPNEGAEDRYLYAGSQQLRKFGYVILSAKASSTGKLVTFLPKEPSIEVIPPDQRA